jgi:HAD superfamily phosphoserine phosphatase-like hydrolase
MQRKAAFFDIDGTLLKGFIICAFPDYLAGRGFFDKRKNERIQELTRLYWEGKISYRHAGVLIPKLYAAGIKGRRQSEIIKLAPAFMREHSRNMRPYTKGLISLMNKSGFMTIAISASPIEALLELKSIGFMKIYGSEMEVRRGVYTGRLMRDLALSESKREVINSLIKRYGINTRDSFAFGDTEQDLPMLSSVGHPVPLNSNPLLREYAMRKGWCIPKDVLKEVKEIL